MEFAPVRHVNHIFSTQSSHSFHYFNWIDYYQMAMFVGIYEATSLDRSRKDSSRNHDTSNGLLDDQDQMPSLPT